MTANWIAICVSCLLGMMTTTHAAKTCLGSYGCFDLITYLDTAEQRQDFLSACSKLGITLTTPAGFVPPQGSSQYAADFQAVNLYTKEVTVKSWGQSVYGRVNTELLSSSPSSSSSFPSFVVAAASGANRLPRYSQTNIVWRGLRLPKQTAESMYCDGYFSCSSGVRATHKSFTSTSTSFDTAASFQQMANTAKGIPVILIIWQTNAPYIASLSSLPGEREVLFVPGTEFEVLQYNWYFTEDRIEVFLLQFDAAHPLPSASQKSTILQKMKSEWSKYEGKSLSYLATDGARGEDMSSGFNPTTAVVLIVSVTVIVALFAIAMAITVRRNRRNNNDKMDHHELETVSISPVQKQTEGYLTLI